MTEQNGLSNNVSPVKEPEIDHQGVDVFSCIQKVRDEIQKLPDIWIGTESIKPVLLSVFGIGSLKRSIKSNGVYGLLHTILPRDTQQYVYSVDTLISLLAPNTVISKASNVIRNVVLLDSMVSILQDKIVRGGNLSCQVKLDYILQPMNGCPIRPSDYNVLVIQDIPMVHLFLVSMSSFNIGDVVELKSPLFKPYSENSTFHATLLYKNATIELDAIDYYLKSNKNDSYAVVICELQEIDTTIVVSACTYIDRQDSNIRRIRKGSGDVYTLLKDRDNYDIKPTWSPGLAFGLIDFNEYVCKIGRDTVSPSSKLLFRSHMVDDIFDKNAMAIVDRMNTAMELHCSRTYAFVGIPGTGKTHLMKKIALQKDDAVVLVPCVEGEGFDYVFVDTLLIALEAIPSGNIVMLLDDFDKYISDEDDQEKQSALLIHFFERIHQICPGGIDENGNPRKSITVIATMNNPKSMSNAIIKRSERFDEVIEIGLPSPFIYGQQLNRVKDPSDNTNFASLKFMPIYWYMRRKTITLADIGNIYCIMKTHRSKRCSECTYTVGDILYAIKCICNNRRSASKEYEL